jgi:surfeit locus 1 family protein
VLSFNNHHLVYAITWFVLAAMVAAAAAYLWYSERQLRNIFANGKQVAVNA